MCSTKVLGLPDWYIEQGPQDLLRERYGLTAEGIYESVKDLSAQESEASRTCGTSGPIGSSGADKKERAIRRRAGQLTIMLITRRKTRQIRVGTGQDRGRCAGIGAVDAFDRHARCARDDRADSPTWKKSGARSSGSPCLMMEAAAALPQIKAADDRPADRRYSLRSSACLKSR